MENHYSEPLPSNLQAASSSQVEAFITSLLGCYPRAEAEDLERYFAGTHAVAEDYPNDILEAAAKRESGLPAKCKFLPRLEELKRFRDEKMRPRIAYAEWESRKAKQLAERGQSSAGRPVETVEHVRRMADEAIAVLKRPDGNEWEESETPERIAERLKAQHGISQEQGGGIPDRGADSWRPAGQNSLAAGRLGGGPRGPMMGKHKHFAIVN